MAEILLSERAVTVYEIAGILILLVILVIQSRKKKEFRERKQISTKKERSRQLDDMLKNPDIRLRTNQAPNPFEIQYSDGVGNENRTAGRQVEIEVRTDTSIRKYLFDLEKEITIGQGEQNDLPIQDETVGLRCCSILPRNGEVYAICFAAGSVVIQRGKNKMPLNHQMVKLQSRDILTVGRTALHITLYE